MLPLNNDDENRSNTGEIDVTWADFRNHMLEPGDVEKIVVKNCTNTVQVFLHPGAWGLPGRAGYVMTSRGGGSIVTQKWRGGGSPRVFEEDV